MSNNITPKEITSNLLEISMTKPCVSQREKYNSLSILLKTKLRY